MSTALTSVAAAEDVAISAEARAHFEAGVEHLRSTAPNRYELAYRELKAAYAASPTWKILGNLGIAAHRLERYGEALDAFERYLDEGESEISRKEARQVRDDIAAVRSELAILTLTVPPSVWVVDRRLSSEQEPIVNRYGPFDGHVRLSVKPGEHEVSLEGKDVASSEWKVSLLAGDVAEHRFDALAAPPTLFAERTPEAQTLEASSSQSVLSEPSAAELGMDEPSRDWTLPTYAALGVAIVAAGTSVGTYAHASGLEKAEDERFRRECPNGADASVAGCETSTQADSRVANWETASAIAAGVAGSALVTALVLALLDGDSEPEASAEADGLVTPWLVAGGLGARAQFRF